MCNDSPMPARRHIPLSTSLALHAVAALSLVFWHVTRAERPREFELALSFEVPGSGTEDTQADAPQSGESQFEAPAEVIAALGLNETGSHEIAAERSASSDEEPQEIELVQGIAAPAESAQAPPNSTANPDRVRQMAAWSRVIPLAFSTTAERTARTLQAFVNELQTPSDESSRRRAAAAAGAIGAKGEGSGSLMIGAASGSAGSPAGSLAGSGAAAGQDAGISRGPAPSPHNQPPPYPAECRRLRQQGTVFVHVIIHETGAVSDPSIARSSGIPALDAAALEAVTTWRFTPAHSGDTPVRCEADVPVVFRLRP